MCSISDLHYRKACLTFDVLDRWSYPILKTVQYSYIRDQEITRELEKDDTERLELGKSWDSLTDNRSTRADNPIHIKVVVELVKRLREGAEFSPITIIAEDDIRNCTGYCVSDGHHRLRAMRYQGIDRFWAEIRGDCDAVNELIELSQF